MLLLSLLLLSLLLLGKVKPTLVQVLLSCRLELSLATENTKDEINDLFDKRGLLRNKTDDKSKHDLEEVKLRLAELCSKKNYEKLNPKLISW